VQLPGAALQPGEGAVNLEVIKAALESDLPPLVRLTVIAAASKQFNGEKPVALPVKELAQRVGVGRNNAGRLLAAAVELGWLSPRGKTVHNVGVYTVGRGASTWIPVAPSTCTPVRASDRRGTSSLSLEKRKKRERTGSASTASQNGHVAADLGAGDVTGPVRDLAAVLKAKGRLL
jgi:hypothetical protein